MPPRPILIGSEIYRRSTYGRGHPLAIPRVSTTLDLIRALGWFDPARYVDSPMATPTELSRFHDPAYIAVLQEAERSGAIGEAAKVRYNIGVNGNPIFPEVFSRPATAVGGTLAATRLLADGGIVYSPAGGTHHGRPDRASGFCYFNDPVLGLLALLDSGLDRVCYLDLDAHHCDGVEDAFRGESRVLIVSVHEAGRWPRTGPVDERAGGTARNLPVPRGFNDSELAFVAERALAPLIRAFEPEALVVQGGADALAEDPLSRLELSNNALWDVVRSVKGIARRLLVLGGGGYNPWSVARCWAGMWAVLNDLPVPKCLPSEAEAVLRQLRWNRGAGRAPPKHWFTTLADPPRRGPVREEIRAVVEAATTPQGRNV